MILSTDKQEIKGSKEAKDLYGLLFWLIVKRQSFIVEFNRRALVTLIRKSNREFRESQMIPAELELMRLGVLLGMDKRDDKRHGDNQTVYIMRDPRKKKTNTDLPWDN
jgi:hypothetical protein